jgi:hypothetical protein
MTVWMVVSWPCAYRSKAERRMRMVDGDLLELMMKMFARPAELQSGRKPRELANR